MYRVAAADGEREKREIPRGIKLFRKISLFFSAN
jgi:hypothetical protein